MSKIKRDFHREVRVVYRANRRVLGVEKTQDECLKLFKLIFPEQFKAKQGEDETYQMPAEKLEQVKRLFRSWHPDGRLRLQCEFVVHQLSNPMRREKFITFCEDITPVAMRIRKLTPAECFTLMDVNKDDIRKIQSSGISNSAQYKLAGNSIVVSCLYHIFKNMFIECDEEPAPGTQLSIW